MNLRTIGIVIRREYLNKVKKKSFLVTTFLVPILMAGFFIGLMVMMMTTKEKTKVIAVVDESGIAMPYLEDTETIDFVDCVGQDLNHIKSRLDSLKYDGVLSISAIDTVEKMFSSDIYSAKPFGMELVDNISSRLDKSIEDYRVASYNIEGLGDILKEVKANVRLRSYTVSEDGEDKVSEAGVNSMLSMILGIVIFLFVTLFGGMVMSAVIEEKSSRIVEVLVSSVKATELMFGKIIGIAMVALTQFFLWIVLSGALIGVGSSVMGSKLASMASDPTAMVESMAGTAGAESVDVISVLASQDNEIGVVLDTLRNLPIANIAVLFVIFFIFGYLLYASLFAAVGSAVENEGDSQQLQIPLTVPLMLAYFIAIYAFRAPDSTIAFWGSIIPFTSPIVMIARLPFGVPSWEIILSVSLLVVTFVICAWASAKIYKVGILMYGKKTTFKDLWKWLRQN